MYIIVQGQIYSVCMIQWWFSGCVVSFSLFEWVDITLCPLPSPSKCRLFLMATLIRQTQPEMDQETLQCYYISNNVKVTTRRNSVEVTITLPGPAEEERVGGYDYNLLDAALAQKYTCIICKLIQRDSTIVSCCGQHFCKSCLLRSFETSLPRCPHCLSDQLQHFTNKQQVREIKSSDVWCPNKERGCVWTGELREVQRHADEECAAHQQRTWESSYRRAITKPLHPLQTRTGVSWLYTFILSVKLTFISFF